VSDGWSYSENSGGATQSGGSEATTKGTSKQRSTAVTRGRQQHFIQRPILEERISSKQYYSVPEQFLGFEQQLVGLEKREAFVVCEGSTAPAKLRTPDVIDPKVHPEWVEQFRADAMAQHRFWLSREEAIAELEPKPEVPKVELKSYGRRRPPKVADTEGEGE
jgi:hypothetical protein